MSEIDAPTPVSEAGIVGLLNLGNTCYANSVLQVLRSIPAFSSQILSKKLHINENAPELLKDFYENFYNLTKQLWKNQRNTTIRPVHFLKSIANLVKGTIYEDFAHNIPNDAHEYYTFLLDKLQHATHQPQKDLSMSATPAEQAWHQSFMKDYSHFVPLFYGQMRRIVQCTKCKTESTTYEIFNSLKINLKDNNLPLIESIKETFKEEEIDEYHCNSCNSSQKATIQHAIIKTPPYLSITINRFAEGFSGKKDTRTFTLDATDALDISSVVSDDTNKLYSLMSTIEHHGSMRGGHYTCTIKHVPSDVPAEMMENGPRPGQWYLYDDDAIHNIEHPLICHSTYMIFLRRV
jgi:ubiquitin C-terminal hydrolase